MVAPLWFPPNSGHTHEDVDLAFGGLLAKVLQRHRAQCPVELATIIYIEMAPWLRIEGRCVAALLRRGFVVARVHV